MTTAGAGDSIGHRENKGSESIYQIVYTKTYIMQKIVHTQSTYHVFIFYMYPLPDRRTEYIYMF
jgi:hypothetical protein